jgi:hypothetical protein
MKISSDGDDFGEENHGSFGTEKSIWYGNTKYSVVVCSLTLLLLIFVIELCSCCSTLRYKVMMRIDCSIASFRCSRSYALSFQNRLVRLAIIVDLQFIIT